MDAEELGEVIPGGAAAEEEDVFAVGRPADDDVSVGMPGEAMWDTAVHGHGVDIDIAVNAGGVGEGLAVGREERAGDDRSRGGEANGIAAGARDGPDVIGVAKGDLIFAERGMEQEQRRSVGNERQDEEREEHSTRVAEHGSSSGKKW